MLSIIIPTLNEAASLPETLTRVSAILGPGDEVIVADGGSTDTTREIAASFGAQIVSSRRGRGTQMNAGASAATGSMLLFLHADTHLPPDAGRLIRHEGSGPEALGGNFALRFDAPGLLPRLFATVYNARSRRSRLFYGDSAIWVTRAVFDAIGGYKEAVLMEDWAFCLALRTEARRRYPGQPLLRSPAPAQVARDHQCPPLPRPARTGLAHGRDVDAAAPALHSGGAARAAGAAALYPRKTAGISTIKRGLGGVYSSAAERVTGGLPP